MTVWVAAVLLVTIASYTLLRLPALHPGQLWALPWAAAVLAFALRLIPYRSIASSTCWLIVLSSTAFVAASVLGARLSGGEAHREKSPIPPGVMESAALGLSVLTFVGLALFATAVGLRFGLRAVFIPTPAVRLGLTAGAIPLTIKYLYAGLAVCGIAPIAANRTRDKRRRLLLRAVTAGSIASMYFTTGRANIIVALITAFTAHLLSGRRKPKLRDAARAAGPVLVITLVAFVVLGNAIGKSFSNSDLVKEHTVFTEHRALRSLGLPYYYLSGPIAALNVQLAHTPTWGTSHGCADLAAVCRVMRALGIDVHPVPSVRPTTAPPLSINVYTGLDLPLLDGGRALAVLIVALQGLLFGWLWGRSQRRRGYAMACYALASTAVLFSYSQNNFLAPHLWGAAAATYAAIWIAGRRGPPAKRIPGQAPETLAQ